MGMTRSILKGMEFPNDLWGEAVRHSTYLINRVTTRVLEFKTPYKALKGKKPNVSHIRVFGCIGYAKVDTPRLRNLNSRSRVRVHLGRDVTFDENKKWNWKNEALENRGAFTVLHGVFRNRGISEDDEEDGAKDGNNRAIATTDQVAESSPSISNEEGDNDDDINMLRRSEREKKKPAYLDDYILMGELDGERLLLSMNDEP